MSSGEVAAGVIGLGFGANHARILREMEGVRLAAVCDASEERLAAVGKGGAVAAYTEIEAMLCAERLDAVVVVVPARLHGRVALAAISAGCAVFVEKPLAPTLAEGIKVAEAAGSAGVPLMVGHIERFNPAIQELARAIRAGDVGRVVQIDARRLAYFVDREREFDVGVVQDMALHDIDILRYLTGAEVARVYAETYAGLRTPFEDGISALLRFEPEGDGPGVIASLEVNWLSPRKVREMSVLGDKGLLLAKYDDFRTATVEFQRGQTLRSRVKEGEGEGPVLRISGRAPGAPAGVPIEAREPLQQELRAFITSLREGTPMPVTAEDGLRALAIADALTESARTGMPVAPEKV